MMEFLSEAVFLSLMGGIAGLIIVYALTFVASAVFDVNIYLTISNIITGIGISVSIGLIAGIIPAYLASRLSPVEAIRSK